MDMQKKKKRCCVRYKDTFVFLLRKRDGSGRRKEQKRLAKNLREDREKKDTREGGKARKKTQGISIVLRVWFRLMTPDSRKKTQSIPSPLGGTRKKWDHCWASSASHY